MKNLKVDDLTESELISKIRCSDFRDRGILNIDNRVWRVYEKRSGRIQKLLYLSNYCELVLKQSFQNFNYKLFSQKTFGNLLVFANKLIKILGLAKERSDMEEFDTRLISNNVYVGENVLDHLNGRTGMV